jgi:type II secretory pathway component PulJ
MFKTVKWNTGSAATRFRLKNKTLKQQATSCRPDGWPAKSYKRQATKDLTGPELWDIMGL